MGARFVFFQFTFIGLLFFVGNPIASGLPGRSIQAIAMLIGIWALFTMKKDTFRIRPEPLETGVLITSGPFKWLRHPMYTSILIFFMPTISPPQFWLRIAFFAALLLTLLFKMEYEEGLLEKRYEGYAEYKKKSYRLIPFLY